MFSGVWSSVGHEQWWAMLISIEGLLKYDQGLIIGELLMVNFCQPSHEFIFGVGIDLISKLTILTLVIYQVRTRMWFWSLLFPQEFKHLNEDTRVKFIEHFARRSWSPTQVKTRGEHNSKWSKDWSVKPWNTEDLNRRCRSSRVKHPYLIREKNDVKDPHAVLQKLKKMREASESKTEVRWARIGPGRPAQLILGIIRSPLWPRNPFGLFIVLVQRATHWTIRHLPSRSREERDTIPERRGSR
jgi:hypothetical protein